MMPSTGTIALVLILSFFAFKLAQWVWRRSNEWSDL